MLFSLFDFQVEFASRLEVCRSGVQESTPAGYGVFQQEPEQDQEWIVSIGTGAGAGVIFNSVFEICIDYLHSTQFVTGVKQEQKSIIFL